MLEKGQKYTVVCDEMNNLGNAVCRIDGVVAFVGGALIGEKVEIAIDKVTSSYALAHMTKIIERSPYRIEAECPHFGECGGCAFGTLGIAHENEIKENYVRSTLKKFGVDATVDKVVCPVDKSYRNKIILFYDGKGFGYMRSSTKRVLPHTRCALNEEIFDKIAEYVLESVDKTHLYALFMRKSSAIEGEIMVCPIFKKKTNITAWAKTLCTKFPQVKSVYSGVFFGREFVLGACKLEKVAGKAYIEDTLCALNFEVSPKSFYQVNSRCAEALYEKAISYLDVNENSTVADLFCGTGTIGLIVANRTGAKVYGVEIEPDAVADARRNARLNGVSNIEFFEGDAKDFNKKVDACVIDPPRKGCSEFAIETLLRLSPEKIVYVSCNPDTLARDLKRLSEKYEISSPVTPFNMFPRTSHVESVVCLTRKESNI